MSNSNSVVTIGTMEVYQKNIPNYGKNASSDLIDVAADLQTVTITANTTNPLAKSGDLIYVYPSLAGSGSVVYPVDGNTLVIDAQFLQNGVGFSEVTSTTTFSGDTDMGAVTSAINTQLAADGLGDTIEAQTVDTDKIRLQAISLNATFSVNSSSTWADTSHKMAEDTPAELYIFGVKDDTTDVQTSVPVSIRFSAKTAPSVQERTDLRYELVRTLGEMTGATLNSSLDPIVYKGLSKVAKQIEYAEGSATLTCDEMAFNIDNLSYVYGWAENTVSGAFRSGKSGAGVVTNSFTEDTVPATVGLFGLHKTTEGGLIMFTADASKTNDMDLSMKKVEYRTYSVEFSLLTSNSKCVWSLISV